MTCTTKPAFTGIPNLVGRAQVVHGVLEETLAGEAVNVTLCGTPVETRVHALAPVGRWRRVTCKGCLRRLQTKPQLHALDSAKARELDAKGTP